jgi:predicted phage-related endonuclease
MIKIHCQQGSEAWHEQRCGKFTASQFKELMSGETTLGYNNLVAGIAGQIISGETESTYSNDNMERGIELEPYAAKEYEDIMETETEEIGFVLPENELAEWVGVSPDRLVGEDGGLEIKCPLAKTHLSYIRANRLPIEYKWQVQGQLWVTGRKWWDFMSFYPNMKPFIIRVYPDLEMHKELKVRLEKAIKDVKAIIESYNDYTL